MALGLDVIVECVNPIALTRDSWAATAADAGAGICEVEVICSDLAEHRRRVLTRVTDVEGLIKPTWAEVAGREYHPWSRPHLTIDASDASPTEAAQRIVTNIAALRQAPSAA